MKGDGQMKISIKIRSIILLAIIFIISLNTLSYGTGMTSNPQIETRGLIFNTGISSDQIRLLKDFFRAREQPNVPWGYSYDNRTKELVRDYQKLKGLKADGIAGKATIDIINKDIFNNKVKIGLRIPYTDIKGDMLIINKSSNTLYFLKDGIIQESYPVATGKTTDLTPNGKFKIVIKFKNPRWGGAGIKDPIAGGDPNNPLGTRWIGISYGGGGRYGVHGNANPRSIGSYASLGCVRMFNQDVEKLYEKVKINTPIWIGSESLLEDYGTKFKSNYKAKEIIKGENIKPPEIIKEENIKPPEIIKEEIIKPKEINININGEQLKLKDPLINKDGTTYYPFREILEFVNATVIWDDENKRATGMLGENYVMFQLNSNEYRNNNEDKYLPEGQKVFIDKGKTYIPIRNLMEGLGYEVYWEESTRTIIINNIPQQTE